MTPSEIFRSHAREYGVSDDAVTRILWNVQPAVHIDSQDPEHVGPDAHVVGYIGGLPTMPEDVPWEEGKQFVASLDLAAVPRQAMDDRVPREGHLLLFADTEYFYPEDGPLSAVHVPPGVPMAERAHPDGAEEGVELLEHRVMVLQDPEVWGILGWPTQEEEPLVLDDDPLLAAAIREYQELVPDAPVVRRGDATVTLRGEKLNPSDDTDAWGEAFRERREEAVIAVRDAPEKFDELHLRALTEASEEEDGPALCLVELAEANVWWTGDGEVTWMIRPDDLYAGRFDRIVSGYFC
ncbi:DUF1963 domain-containing protein [Nocardiopsis algeriensis]|uniref:DUF1963 domain-containing protein n=1 Tax=Nocardiopsis algeriensis TaxID=1478215 RepID=A0A841IQ44_9ACTN|nr:hypothetical protein [Nocardiopsis algeriensis]